MLNNRMPQIVICVFILLCYIFLDSDTCTQGSIDFYTVTMIRLCLLIALFIIFDIVCIYSKLSSILLLEISKIVVSVVGILKSMPYFINTTLKGISLCQGSTGWGGFNNRYGFESLPEVSSVFERILPLIYLLIIFLLLVSFVLNLFLTRKL